MFIIPISKFQIFKKNITHFQITLPDFHFGVPKKRKVATQIISYKRYGELLFHKVASGYLLHFVQDGSSKNALGKSVLHNNVKNQKIGNNAVYITPSLPLIAQNVCRELASLPNALPKSE